MTHLVSPDLESWVPVKAGSPFPIQNLPYGIFSKDDAARRVGVAIGDHILDLDAVARAGLFDGLDLPGGIFSRPTLNRFLRLGRPAWTEVRALIVDLLSAGNDELERAGPSAIVPQADVAMHLPASIGDFVDFYSSVDHASNVGKLFRPDTPPLLPNWRHLPVAYHGRAGTVVVSGADVRRPRGQRRGPDGTSPTFGPSIATDFELEVGFVTGDANILGEPVPVTEAEEHIFGMCLINDWSARDLQAWEYQPLGPFLSKSFATSASPWIVPLDAIAPYRVDPPRQDPEVLPYLRTEGPTAVDLQLEAVILSEGGSVETTVSRVGFAGMYWTMAQQLAHATVNGATARAGDLFASGTVSGAEPGSQGCLLELTRNGNDPITLEDGSERSYLRDGDTVILRGWCGGEPGLTIGFGECRGSLLPA